ncbi:hypothetical protein ACFVAD_07905 [Sutcliffiella sp. NPDC057660]|uniref:hypothetical protein n=1 Tax=Sutcliffiella sp. NPDC057660 TaxID=3346199 RepID=UPI0036A7C6A3
MKTIDMNELKLLFNELILILEKFGDRCSINNQKRIIQETINIIESDLDYEEKVVLIRREYSLLYPPRGGLTEFNIWRDDFEERKRVNEPFDKISNRLWDIFK